MRPIGEQAACGRIPGGTAFSSLLDRLKGGWLQQQDAVVGQGVMRFAQDMPRVRGPKHVELAKDQHRQAKPSAVLGDPNVLMQVGARKPLFPGSVDGIGDGRRRKIDARAFVSQPGEPAGVQPRPAAQVQDFRPATRQQMAVDPGYVGVDLGKAAAGQVVILAQVLLQHPLAKARVVPGDLCPFRPRNGRLGSIDQVHQVHLTLNPLRCDFYDLFVVGGNHHLAGFDDQELIWIPVALQPVDDELRIASEKVIFHPDHSAHCRV